MILKRMLFAEIQLELLRLYCTYNAYKVYYGGLMIT